MKQPLLLLWSAILSSFVFFQTSDAFAQKIYLLAFYDPTDSNLSDVFQQDVWRIMSAFDSNATEAVVFYNNEIAGGVRGETPEWGGEQLYLGYENSDGIFRKEGVSRHKQDSNYNVFDRTLEAIKKCPAGSNDVIVIYWSGHGFFEDGKYFLEQNNGAAKCERKKLLEAAKDKGARLTVLFTDSCAIAASDVVFGGKLVNPSICGYPISPLFEELFFNYRGTLDVNAASESQKAFSYKGHYKVHTVGYEASQSIDVSGGCFSLALTSRPALFYPFFNSMPQWMRSKVEGTDNSGGNRGFGAFDVFVNQTPSWDEVLEYVRKTTKFVFQQTRSEQNSQDIKIFEKPTRISGRPKPSVGNGNYGNLDWSTSKTTHPEIGDRVVEINGQKVRNAADAYAKVAASPSNIVLKLVDHRSARVFYLRTTLYPSSYSSRLGLYLADDSRGGARITDYVSGYPITQCQYAWENGGSSGGSSGGFDDDFDDFDDLDWSSTWTAHPEIGDRLVEINGRKARDARDVYAKVAASPTLIVLKFVDHRNGRPFYMRTKLYPSSYQSRLGLYLADDPRGGAKVTGCASGYPIMRCQYAWE